MKWLFIFLIFVLGSVLVSSYFVLGNYSSGYRAGQVMKISKKGVVFKTWEGQLDVGGLEAASSDGAATTIWSFSVKDQDVVDEINTVVDQGTRAKLYYQEKFYKFPWWGDTKYYVYKVEGIK